LFTSILPLLCVSTLFPYTTLFRSVFLMARNGKYEDLTGKTFGMLKVLGRDIGKTVISNSCFWICECQCRDKTIVSRRTSTLKCGDRKSTRLNSSHVSISYAVFCLR